MVLCGGWVLLLVLRDPTLYISQIKPHLIIISELSREKSQNTVICSGCAFSVKAFCLHFYTIKLQLFSYISEMITLICSVFSVSNQRLCSYVSI